MGDPWGSFQNFVNSFKQMASNPVQYVMSRYGISEDIANDPDAIIQKMMQDGKVSQQQYDSARQAAYQIQNNPMFRQLMGGGK